MTELLLDSTILLLASERSRYCVISRAEPSQLSAPAPPPASALGISYRSTKEILKCMTKILKCMTAESEFVRMRNQNLCFF